MSVRVIGLGQPAAGDDGVGCAVITALRSHALTPGVELLAAAEPSALLPLLETSGLVVLIDAVLGTPTGQVMELVPDDLACRGLAPLSTHGVSIAQAVELARVLAAGRPLPAIRLVAVTIARPDRYRSGLSPRVAAAVPDAARRVAALVEDRDHRAWSVRKSSDVLGHSG